MRKSHTFLLTLFASLLTLACDPDPVDVDDDLYLNDGATPAGDVTAPTSAKACTPGDLGCACMEAGDSCEPGLKCVKAPNGNGCFLAETETGACDHGLSLDLPGKGIGYACVPSCERGDDCGWLDCMPLNAAVSELFCGAPTFYF